MLSSPVVIVLAVIALLLFVMLSAKKPAPAASSGGPFPGWSFRSSREAAIAEDGELIRDYFCAREKERLNEEALARMQAYMQPNANSSPTAKTKA